MWSEESCDESSVENSPEPDFIWEAALYQDVRSYLRVAEISWWVAVVLREVLMQDGREEPGIRDTSFLVRLFFGGGLRKAKLVQKVLIDQLRVVDLSVLDNAIGLLNVSCGGPIQTAYISREALYEVSKEIAEFYL